MNDEFIDNSSSPWRDVNSCPCPDDGLDATHQRYLTDAAPTDGPVEPIKLWEVIYTSFVLLFMLIALLSDRVGADGVMLTALTLFLVSSIITVEEGIAGFANDGLLTVIILFVVAQGISVTGALDWYMGKLLGRPKTMAGAQLRLMIPIAIVSAFLNNTPVVAVMIPIVQRWAKNIGVSPQQLLIPLSFSSILGGTCTLIGTSTNLIVVGLLEERYPDDPDLTIGLFDLGEYGVPVAIIGMTYIMVASPFLLPGAQAGGGNDILQDSEQVLLGARLTQWSPAAGRTVKRSGLRDTGGIYLVSVHRATTGNVHRAVSQDFVLNVGDTLYFTGLVESFGEFCEENGLELITNETTVAEQAAPGDAAEDAGELVAENSPEEDSKPAPVVEVPAIPSKKSDSNLTTVHEGEEVPVEIGITAASLRQADEMERMRTINRMTDQIRGTPREEESVTLSASIAGKPSIATRKRYVSVVLRPGDPAQIVVTTDTHDSHRLVVVGINARDRPGLLLDISKGLLRLSLQLRHTEASVVGDRSISIWRCEYMGGDLPDLEEFWSILNALLESGRGVAAVKKRGIRVIRAVVTPYSRLVDKAADEVNFRQTYKAAIIAVQKAGKNTSTAVKFSAGDMLILQASDTSPLLKEPPKKFYAQAEAASKSNPPSRNTSGLNLARLVNLRFSHSDLKGLGSGSGAASGSGDDQDLESNQLQSADTFERENATTGDDFFIQDSAEDTGSDVAEGDKDASDLDVTEHSVIIDGEALNLIWRDLRVTSIGDDEGNTFQSADGGFHQREFLAAMEIAPKSALANQTVAQSGLDKLIGVFLVSIERPVAADKDARKSVHQVFVAASDMASSAGFSVGESRIQHVEQTFITISPEQPLQDGDVLWFAGSASAVGDLRKIPGLKSFDSDQVEKINSQVHDRRLVQAVIARKGPLVGKTVREVRFRTRYGAAVISVHREGNRIHEHPGQIKLQAGDVLLLEAGPTFIRKNGDNDRSFALLAEVEDSAPPRLEKLIPACLLTIAMLAVFTAGVASLLTCALVAGILMVATGIMSQQEARDAVNWDVYITIACAFGIGTALVNSGVAGGVADFLVAVGGAIGIGDAGLYGAVYLATFLISNVVTNNAAAALLFPIAMDAAEQTGADLLLMSYTLMLGASASFMSPFGYTTNLLIYGPGGYKFKDFLSIGSPMQIVLWILSIVILSSTKFDWWISWLICLLIFVIVAAIRLTNGQVASQLTDQLQATAGATAAALAGQEGEQADYAKGQAEP